MVVFGAKFKPSIPCPVVCVLQSNKLYHIQCHMLMRPPCILWSIHNWTVIDHVVYSDSRRWFSDFQRVLYCLSLCVCVVCVGLAETDLVCHRAPAKGEQRLVSTSQTPGRRPHLHRGQSSPTHPCQTPYTHYYILYVGCKGVSGPLHLILTHLFRGGTFELVCLPCLYAFCMVLLSYCVSTQCAVLLISFTACE